MWWIQGHAERNQSVISPFGNSISCIHILFLKIVFSYFLYDSLWINVVEVRAWLLKLAHKRYCGFLLALSLRSLTLEEVDCHVGRTLNSAYWHAKESRPLTNNWWGAEASCYQPCEWNILEAGPPRLRQAFRWLVPADVLTETSWEILSQNHLTKPLQDSWPWEKTR